MGRFRCIYKIIPSSASLILIMSIPFRGVGIIFFAFGVQFEIILEDDDHQR